MCGPPHLAPPTLAGAPTHGPSRPRPSILAAVGDISCQYERRLRRGLNSTGRRSICETASETRRNGRNATLRRWLRPPAQRCRGAAMARRRAAVRRLRPAYAAHVPRQRLPWSTAVPARNNKGPREAARTAMLQKRNSPEAARARPAAFVWDDPFLLEEQLTRRSAWSATPPAPTPRTGSRRDPEAHRHERFDREIMTEMGALGLLGPTIPEDVRRRRRQLRRLRPDRARDRAGRLGLPLGDERAVVPRHAPDLRLRHRRAARAKYLPKLATRRVGRLLRPDRARRRLRPGAMVPARGRSTAATPPGAKTWITNAPIADVLVVWAKSDAHGGNPGLPAGEGHEGPRRAEDRGQVLPARLGHRHDPDGRGPRPGGEPAAARRGPRRPVRLPQPRALRHRLGRDGRRRVLLARRPRLHAGAQAVRPPARPDPAGAEEARRHADRDRARAAGRAPPRPADRRGPCARPSSSA